MMKNYVLNYINNLTISDIINLANKKNINLSLKEADFIYIFLKNNKENLVNDPLSYDFDDYKAYFEENNYWKIKQLIEEYKKLIK